MVRLPRYAGWPFERGVTAAVAALILLAAGCTSGAPGASPATSPARSPGTSPATSLAPTPAESESDTDESAYLAGTLTWSAVRTYEAHTNSVEGHAELMLHFVGSGLWLAERGGGSTYAYDGTYMDCSPVGHLSGVLESGVGVGGEIDPEWHIGVANVSVLHGDDPPGLSVDVSFNDEWAVTCPNPDGTTSAATAALSGVSFPGCDDRGSVDLENDGTGHYVVDCDVVGVRLTGHIAGELHPIDGPAASP